MPTFLTNDINKKIENLILMEKYNKNFEQMNKIYELKQILFHYYKFINGETNPFNSSTGHNNEELFLILIYSNIKDIYKSKKIKKIFIDNYDNIINSFNLFNYDQNKFYYIINNVNLNFNESEVLNLLLYNYNKKPNYQMHLYILCSYFYLIMNLLKDTNDNYNTGAF